MKARKILSAIIAIAMIATFAVSASAADGVTLPDGVTADSFGANTVTDGTNYYATMTSALAGIHGTDNAVLYCKPGADVGLMTHGHVCKNLTVYGNGAYVSAGEQDFEIDYPKASGNSCAGLTGDVTLTVDNLKGAGAWGTRQSDYTVNYIFENCEDMGKVYLTGTNGTNNITLTDCSFTGNDVSSCKVYSNAAGTITLTNVDFSNTDQPVALNNKSTGIQTIVLKNCDFTSCGASTADWTVPVSVKSSVEGGTSSLTVDNCTFTGTIANSIGQDADIILDYGVGTTTASVSSTSARVLVETEANVGTTEEISSSETKSFTNIELATPVAKIGDVEYTDLQTAIDEATDGAEIAVLTDIVLTENAYESPKNPYQFKGYAGVIIPDDKTVTIDLAGHAISYSDTYGNCDNVAVYNIGNLTIKDSGTAETGKISYVDVADNVTYNQNHAVIFNVGVLTIEGGTIEHLDTGNGTVSDAIDNNSNIGYNYGNDVICTINGGRLIGAEYRAIRQYTHYNEGVDNRVEINDGTIMGGIYMQHGDSWYYAKPESKRLNVNCELEINGGIITTLDDGYGHIRSYLNNPDNEEWSVAINGGTIEVPVQIQVQKGYRYSEDGMAASGTLITGEATGTRNAEWLENNGGFITGGTFSNIGSTDDVTTNLASFLVDGYTLTENTNGTYGVVKVASVDPAFGTNNGVIKLDATETDHEAVILATIDSLNYQNVGLEVTFGAQTITEVLDTVYEAVKAKRDENSEPDDIKPSDFGGNGKFIFLSKVTFGISHDATEEFSFRPFATKLDGTVIYGKTTIDTIGK